MLIPARYPGKCKLCGEAIEVGDPISWQKGDRTVAHAACSSEGRAIAQSAEASRATDSDVELAAPDGLSYMPFQKAGIAYALPRSGVIFGDEMGLGKTIQAIGVVNNDPTIKTVLVVCPKSLALNWIREWRKWDTRGLKIGSIPGACDVLILTREEAKKRTDQLCALQFDAVIGDEAHEYRNPKSQRTKAFERLAASARRKRMLITGTPIPNKVVELWSLLKMTDPDNWDPLGKGFFKFATRYCAANKDSGYWDFSGSSNLEELQQRLRGTCMVRRLKKDVLTELPAKRRQIIELPAKGALAKAIEAEQAGWERVAGRLEELRAAVEISRASDDPADFSSAVASLNKASVASFAEISRQRHAVAVAKLPFVCEHVANQLNDGDGKIIVFAHHLDIIDALKKELAPFGVVSIDGRVTDNRDRQAAVDRFQTDPNVRVFIGGISAAGVGITLTASSHVVFAELDWVPGNMQQAEDRAHRIGQLESVLVQLLVLEGSLDARMAEVLVAKMDVADRGLDVQVRKEPALPMAQMPATAGATSAELFAEAAKLTPVEIKQIHAALRLVAGMCDGAQARDGSGFSKIDVRIGTSLAGAARLTPKQAALGKRICHKYRRQLGEGCWAA